MLRILPILIFVVSCSDTSFKDEKGTLARSNGLTGAQDPKEGPEEPAKPAPDPQAAVTEDEDSVTVPGKVTGTYLRCQYVGNVRPTAADLGCNFQSQDGNRVTVDPAGFDIAHTAVSQANTIYSIQKASSVDANYVIQIAVQAEEGNLASALNSLQISVKDLTGSGQIADATYSLPDISPPIPVPTVPQAPNPPVALPEVTPPATPPVDMPVQVVCGGVGDLCYGDAEALAKGTATTPSGKNIEYVLTLNNFKVWKEVGGQRILKPDGSDNWAKALNTNGKGYSAVDMVSSSTIAGRTCPPNVFIDDARKFEKGNCLYYSKEGASRLNASGTNGILGLGAATAARWYAGNISACSNKGMRLPTAYEAMDAAGETTSAYPYANGTPQFAGSQAIPSSGYAWTATTYVPDLNQYMVWSPGNILRFDATANVICVVP